MIASESDAAAVNATFPAPRVYLSEAQFCERYGVGHRTVQRWRVSGGGPPWCRLGVRRILYPLAASEAWAASRTYQSRAAEIAAQSRECGA